MDFESEIRERMTAVEQSVKSAHHRLDTQDKLIGSVQKLTQQVIQLANEVKNMREDINLMATKVDKIEKIPISRYNSIVKTLITAIVSGAAGYFVNIVLN
ncbi:MAG: hypothetical protein SOW78_02290 [Clostridia bacterium]|nr:hypothetical protein [Clostridia bacterium]